MTWLVLDKWESLQPLLFREEAGLVVARKPGRVYGGERLYFVE